MFVPAKKRAQPGAGHDVGKQMEERVTDDEYIGHDMELEVVNINVAGKRFQTYSKTLGRFPHSLLGDPSRRVQFFNPETKELFFDRHRPTFEAILYYYQSGGVMARPPNIPVHIFINELIFFDIGDELIEKLQIENGLKEPVVVAEVPTYLPFKILWAFLEDPSSSKAANIFAITSVGIIVLSLIMFVVETLPEFAPTTISVNGTDITYPNKHEKWMFNVNTAVICWFTVEFILRLICCPNKLKFFIEPGNIIDFLSILPYYISLALASNQKGSFAMLRVIRVLRVFKLARHSRGLQILGNTLKASFNELMMLGFFLFVMILIFGSCVYYAEYSAKGTKFVSIPNSFWWAIVTMTTVGYGDMYPTTFWGKIVGAMAVVCGVLTIALPVPVVVSNFEYFYTKERNRRKTEEAKKEQAKKIEEQAVRERVNGRIDLIRNYAKNFRKVSFRKFSKKETQEAVLEALKSNGSCHRDLSEEITEHSDAELISTV